MPKTYQRIVLASRPARRGAAGQFPARRGAAARRRPRDRCSCATTSCRSIPTCAAAWRRRSRTRSRKPIGETMVGGTVGIVEASNNPGFAVGRHRRRHARLAGIRPVATAQACNKVDATHVPMSAYLGVLGMPGVTAWYGLQARSARPRPARRCWCRRRAAPWARSSANWPRCGLPCRRHRRRARKVRVRDRRTRLRCLHRPSPAHRRAFDEPGAQGGRTERHRRHIRKCRWRRPRCGAARA